MDEFESLLEAERVSVERFVKFRMSSMADAEDVLQAVFLTAYQKFSQLKNKDAFKAWIISIARNKCNDYFRKKAVLYEIPIDELTDQELSDSRHGVSVVHLVRETLSLLGDKEQTNPLSVLLEGDAPGGNRETAGHSCGNSKKQTAYSKTEFQK